MSTMITDRIYFIGSGSDDTYVFGYQGFDLEIEVMKCPTTGYWLDADTLEPVCQQLNDRFTALMNGAD